MSDMVPEVLNAALDSLFTPKEPGEQEYQGVDGMWSSGKRSRLKTLAFCYGEMSELESPLWRHVLPMRCWIRAFQF